MAISNLPPPTGRARRAPGVPGVAALLLLACGCRIFPEWESVTLGLPRVPESWIESGVLPGWEVRAHWAGGEAGAEVGPGGRVGLRLPRGETAAVLAYPVWAGRRLRPAGAVYPLDGDEKLELGWEGGYKAEAARVLILAGKDPARFDLDRLLREALERLGDPWLRPPAAFGESFAEEDFRVTLLNPPELFSVVLDGLAGPAVPESPFGAPLAPDGSGRAEVSAPVGVSRWYASWGRVSLELREDGEATWAVFE